MDFARDSTPGAAPLMRATVYAREDSPLINMEAFISYISTAQCSASQIKLTFSSQEATDVAKQWPQSFQLMTSGAAFCPGSTSAGRTFYSVSKVTFTGNTATMAVTQSDMSKSLSRIVTKFDTQNLDGTGATSSGKVRKQKRVGNNGSAWAHLSINSFPQWAKDFISGYKAGYRAIVAGEPIDPSKIGTSSFNSVVQCDNCGVEADVGIYGGYDYDFWKARFSYANVGFKLSNAVFTNTFSITVEDGFTFDKHVILGSLELPGLNFYDVLELKPIVKLSSDIGLSVQGGSMNIDGLGLQFVQTSETKLEFDLVNRGASASGWAPLEPRINIPRVGSTPSNVQFRGAIGPEFGIVATLLPFLGSFSLNLEMTDGLHVPALRVDISDYHGDTRNCIRDSKSPSYGIDYPVSLRASAGVGVYSGFGVSAGKASYNQLFPIYTHYWDAGSMCLMLAGPQVSNPNADITCRYCAF